ncbi:phosphate-starvation-inducible PsiE family protein [Alcanivorax sp.]|uniref:phosphate-starvation-inducible PsiE family protein n=1 Tax=Alcanivorax sp. TaxID=1872427 RepID=UPI0025872B65|nr:phosphate-starvation-inducible PsiE family protein [Alcanivorax sp.]
MNQLPRIERFLTLANKLLHIFIALALLAASVLVIAQFIVQAWQTVEAGSYARGFLTALGNLFVLWILSSLISAEVRWLKTGIFDVLVFIEVALITLLRQLVILPVELGHDLKNWAWAYGLITFAILAVGIVYFLMQRQPPPPVEDPL